MVTTIKPSDINTIFIDEYYDTSIKTEFIKPKMIEVSINDRNAFDLPDNLIKSKLIELLTEKLLNDNCVIFTKIHNPIENCFEYIARLYVTPDTQTRQILISNGIL